MMTAVGAEVTGSWFLMSGVAGFFIILLLLSIFLTALCSECSKRSFELRDPEADKDPSTLIRVVKLEDAMVARENPMINEIQNDEKDLTPREANTVSFTPWRSHLGASQNHKESNPEEETSVPFTPWRSHLREPENQDHIYHTIGGGQSSSGGDADVSSLPTNQEPGEEHHVRYVGDLIDRNSVYARVSKKARPTTPPIYPPEEVQVDVEGSLPPLPDRRTQLEE
ncbi:uncharacterized protein si:ch73-204p21.2 isoform X2 [Plectropomus leopardus]|uniref:uncharacterized protein si:ch73-204p21.2 isoform X2 n=1 Tax=Plectropomus leopardus TaxID=160734 RepID=UPI001C4A8CAA|nr:uncharacterized protein si:ch73-204p21.2 isoform X2 [Plectropomus leopardus]